MASTHTEMTYLALLIIGIALSSVSGLGKPAFLQYYGSFCMGVTENLVEMKCPRDASVVIVTAMFGRDDQTVCPAPNDPSLDTARPCNMMDVRAAVEEKCRGRSSCSFELKEDVFPPHCRGIQKYLRVDYDCRYAEKTVLQCQGMDALTTLSCENEDHVLKIVSAFWGRQARSTCPGLSGTANTNCSKPQIGQYVEQLCQHKKDCTLCPNSWGFDDPCEGTNKYLEVNYICAECANFESDENCNRWAANGECEDNPTWMTANCKKSCWGCGLENTCTNSVSEPSCDCLATQGECATNREYMSTRCQYSCNLCDQACTNKHSNDTECDIYANISECELNPEWMVLNCARSCGFCQVNINVTSTTPPPISTDDPSFTTEPEACININPNDTECDIFALDGECEANPDWMKVNCKRSCGECELPPTPTPMSTATVSAEISCENAFGNDSACDSYAARGECEANPNWMLVQCQKACDACSQPTSAPATCVNKFMDDIKCERYADSGECANNPDWMNIYCAKACNHCEQNATSTIGTSPCINAFRDDTRCFEYARSGECETNTWMLDNCAKACNACGQTTMPVTTSAGIITSTTTTTVTPSITASTMSPSTVSSFIVMSSVSQGSMSSEATVRTTSTTTPKSTPKSTPTEKTTSTKKSTLSPQTISTTQMPSSSSSPSPSMPPSTTTATKLTTQSVPSSTEPTSTASTSTKRMASTSTERMETATIIDLFPGGQCVNRHVDCEYWATTNQCINNPEYMHENCRPACKVCQLPTTAGPATTDGTTTTKAAPTTTTPPTTTSSTTRRATTTQKMKTTPPSTVSVETKMMTTTSQCFNAHGNDVDCDSWAASGLCSLIQERCAKSCNTCGIQMVTTTTERATVPTVKTTVMTPPVTPPRTRTTPAGGSTEEAPVTGDQCINVYRDGDCLQWAQSGLCQDDQVWMRTNCYKTCMNCTADPTSPPVVRETTTRPEQACVNAFRNDEQCESWAEGNLCEVDDVWMYRNCYKACVKCGQPSTSTTTTQPTTTGKMMTSTTTTPKPTTSDMGCIDREGETLCGLWQRSNQCETSPDYMRQNCAKSCGFCKVTMETTRTRRPPTSTSTTAARTAPPSTSTDSGRATCEAGCVNGVCTSENQCVCSSGWTGLRCDRFKCDVACGDYGTCAGPNVCQCEKGWMGATCNEPICESGCNGKGVCTGPNRCLCYPYWTGDDCSECGVEGVGKACLPCPPCDHGTCVSDGENTVRAYIGCFADPSHNDLQYLAWRGQTTTTWMCVQECHRLKYRYAGTQNGNECLCGNMYGRSGASAACSMPCEGGQPKEICGGVRANSIYKVQDGVCQCESFYGGRLCDRCSEGFTGGRCQQRVIIEPNFTSPPTRRPRQTSTTVSTTPYTTTTERGTQRPTYSTTTRKQKSTPSLVLSTIAKTRFPPLRTGPPPITVTLPPIMTRPVPRTEPRRTTPSTTMKMTSTTVKTTTEKTTTTTSATTPTPKVTPTTTPEPKPTTGRDINSVREPDVGPVRGQTGIDHLTMTIVLPSIEWDDDFINRLSDDYQNLVKVVQVDLDALYAGTYVKTVEILRFRNGSVIVEYQLRFSQAVGDQYAVMIECLLSDKENKSLDKMSIKYKIPSQIDDRCRNRDQRCMNRGTLGKSPNGIYYCTCNKGFGGTMCETNDLQTVESAAIAGVGFFLPIIGLLLLCWFIRMRRKNDNHGDSKSNLVNGYDTGTVSFQYQGMDGTKSSQPTSTADKKKNIADYTEDYVNLGH